MSELLFAGAESLDDSNDFHVLSMSSAVAVLDEMEGNGVEQGGTTNPATTRRYRVRAHPA
jgi:hypothetical protein